MENEKEIVFIMEQFTKQMNILIEELPKIKESISAQNILLEKHLSYDEGLCLHQRLTTLEKDQMKEIDKRLNDLDNNKISHAGAISYISLACLIMGAVIGLFKLFK